jgi:enoyl-CoA hydratase/carnithine racemase
MDTDREKNELVLVEKTDGKIAVITMNNPPMNLNTLDTMESLREAFRLMDADEDVHVVVLTGAGTRAFNVGSDLSGFKNMQKNFVGIKYKLETDLMNTIEFLGKPVIAAIEGWCLGGGLEIALSCDLRIMSETTRIGLPEIDLGLFACSGGVFRLPKIIGQTRALEMMLTGKRMDAQECLRLGLANAVVPPGSAVKEALVLAETIAQKPLNAVKVIKKATREMWLKTSKENYYPNLELIEEIFNHANGVEGVAAFLEKRPPKFI